MPRRRSAIVVPLLLVFLAASAGAQEPEAEAPPERPARARAAPRDTLGTPADTMPLGPRIDCPAYRALPVPPSPDSLAVLPDTTQQKIRERTPIFPGDLDPYTPAGLGCPERIVAREELAGWPAASLAEILPRIFPLAVDEQGGPGFFSDARFPSGLPSQTRILIDGRPLDGPLGPAADLRAIPLAAVERLEIYRGTAPVTGGAEAGWIHVVTRTHLTPQANSVLRFDLGSLGREGFSAAFGRWLGSRFSALVTLRFDDGSTLTDVASARTSQFFGKARVYLSRWHFVEGQYGTSGITTESRLTAATPLSPFTETEDRRERRLQVLYRGRVGPVRPQALFYADRFEEREAFLLSGVSLLEGKADRRGARASALLGVGRGTAQVGAEWLREELDSESPVFLGAAGAPLPDSTGFEDARDRVAAFAGTELAFDSLTLAAHARVERFDVGSETRIEPGFGVEARYGAGGGLTPFARVGRSTRLPSFVEAAALARAAGAGALRVGTAEELRAGSAWGRGEVLAEVALFARRGTDATLWLPPTGWRSATGDETARLPGTEPGEEPAAAFAELNQIDQRALGLDLRAGLPLPLGLHGEGYALLQTVEDTDGNRLPYVPQAQALGRLTYEKAFFPSRNLSVHAAIDSRVVGPRTTLAGEDLPAFAQMDALLKARLIGFTAGISVQNVFDQSVRTEEAFPLPGRVVGFEIQWEFWD